MGERSHEKQEALDLGTSVHLTMQELCEATQKGKSWELAEALDVLYINMDSQDIEFSTREAQEEAIQQHESMIAGLVNKTSKLSELLDGCDIIACEKDFQYKIDLPFAIRYQGQIFDCVYLIGSIDLILKDKNGDFIVVDYKSGKKLFDKSKIKKNLQLPIYSLVVKSIYGKLPVKTLYYFTRFDEVQCVEPLAETEDDAEIVYYKNGKIKSKQRTIKDIYDVLMNIFQSMYTNKEYRPSPTALCSWCAHGAYGKNDCKFKMLYFRADIDLPDGVY